MAHIFATGMAVQDFVFHLAEMPEGGKKFRAEGATITGGGCAANAAVTAARLGARVSMAARLGGDQIGDMILRELQDEGVNTDCILRETQARSGFSSIYVSRDGERQIVNFRGSGLRDDPGFLELPPDVDVAMADSRWVAGAAKTIEIANIRGIPVLIDAEAPLDLDDFASASHIAFSRPALLTLCGEADISSALRAVSARTSAWLCVTDGANGAYFIEAGQVEHVPGFAVRAVDTLGAGDVWHGAFALCLSEGDSAPEAIVFANAAAALKCTKSGGRQGSPKRAEVEQLLRNNGGAV